MSNLFGLAITLDYQDNATSGLLKTEQAFRGMKSGAEDYTNSVNNQANAFNNLAVQGASNIYAGKQIMGMGTGIAKGFVDATMGIVEVGSATEKTRITLEALYKSKELAEEKLKWAVDFGAKTPFNIEDMMSTMVGMKAAGVEVDQAVTTVGGHTQELMGYIGDLSALRPDVGMSRMAYAIRNALGGNVKSLVAALDVNVNELIGRKFGAGGAETIAQDIADLVEALGAEGLMNDLFGTWSQMISEISDQVFRIKLAIADTGVFDKAKEILKSVFDLMAGLSDSDVDLIAKNLSGIFDSMLRPAEFLVKQVVKLVNWFIELIKYNPEVVQFAVSFGIITSAVLIFLGGMTILLGVMQISAGVLGKFGLSVIKLGVGFKGGTPLLLKFVASLGLIALKVAVVIGAMKLLYDFFKDDIKKAGHTVSETFRILKLDTEEFAHALKRADTEDNVFGGLMRAIAKAKLITEGFFQMWKKGTIDEDIKEKLEVLGALPVLENLISLKEAVEEVWKGFKGGLKDIWQELTKVAISFGDGIKYLDDKLSDLGITTAPISKAFGKMRDIIFPQKADGSGTDYEKLGEQLAFLSTIFVGGKLLGGLSKFVKFIGGFSIVKGASVLMKGLGKAIWWVVKKIVLLGMANPVIAAIITVLIALALNWDFVKEKAGIAIDFIKDKIDFIKDKLSTFGTNVRQKADEMLQAVVGFFTDAKEGIVRDVKQIKTDAIQIWTDMKTDASAIWEGLKTAVSNKIGGIKTRLEEFKTGASAIWDSICVKADEIWASILGFGERAVGGIQTAWGNVVGFFAGIWEGIMAPARAMFNWLEEKFGAIIEFAGKVKTKLGEVVTGYNDAKNKYNEAKKYPRPKESRSNPGYQPLATGGLVKAEGVALLHPNEVVINDILTQRLGSFLQQEEKRPKEANNKIVTYTPVTSTEKIPTNKDTKSTNYAPDNRITIERGAIQITMTDGNESEVDSLVDLLWSKIKKKQEIEDIMNYKPLRV